MLDYFMDNSLLGKARHGFLPMRSTVTNLLLFDKAIIQNLNYSMPCDVILLYFSQAFDKVSHKLFLHKLASMGINVRLYMWLTGFLKDRRQYVAYGEAESNTVSVPSKVMQGSVISP